MIKKLLYTLMLIPALSLNAQNNGGFENWSNSGGYDNPDGWISLNFLSVLGDSLSCFKSTTSYTGKYSAELRTVYSGLFSDTIPGILVQTAAYSSKPNSLRFAFQHTNPRALDSAYVGVEFYKGVTSDPNNIIGYADVNAARNSNWQMAQENITWTGVGTPDSVVITVTSGINFGSSFKIDDISLSAFSAKVVRLEGQQAHVNFDSEGQLHINGVNIENATVSLYNTRGQSVFSEKGNTNNQFATIALPTGIYFFRIESSEKGEVYTGKVIRH